MDLKEINPLKNEYGTSVHLTNACAIGTLSGPGEERPNVVMRNQWSPMGPGKSDEHPPYDS
ncbi:hypothetical protein Taro_011461 [Colocasia esculenta]|uniref:Uncharacterized protein n=1 Tax=Colocasia esculenta TaxID=4460 RepID=A0A843U5Y8_COLES|nr:hypothetical protein [Colocasia esculenta]